jgi:hypothetical protein
MRGTDRRSGELFSYIDLEARVRADHPLRSIRAIADEALGTLSKDFAALYSGMGRRSRLRCCFARCCCRPSTRSARSGS